MYFSKIEHFSTVNGPGIRCVLWVSGCDVRCKGCQNPQTWDAHYGQIYTVADTETILDVLKNDWCTGITVCGGEPFFGDNPEVLAVVLQAVKQNFPKKDVWCYTGHLYEEIKDMEMMKFIDVLIDGPFKMELYQPDLDWKGSTNQRVIDVRRTKEKGEIVLWNR